MSPLIDLLQTHSLPTVEATFGRYDPERGLRVDDRDRPIVGGSRSLLSTETRGGRDRDEAPQDNASLGTVTKQQADRDEPLSLLVTKTAGGRDTDDPMLLSALLGTVTFVGPDRD